jgi:hypothetical protein
MPLWEKNIPKHLTEKSNIQLFIVFTAVFALVFINIYAPFSMVAWFNLTDLQLLLYSSVVILIGILVLVFSRILMFHLGKTRSLNFGEYSIWIAVEIILMALSYSFIQYFLLDDPRDFLTVLKKTIQTTALVVLLPYVIIWLYLSRQEKKRELDRLNSNFYKPVDQKQMLPFMDEKGNMKFSLKKEDLLYLEASDNYVSIYYLDQNKISTYLLRNNLKRIDQDLLGTGLLRCHRSYMVNFEKIKLIRRDKDGLILELDNVQKTVLPVSRTYIDNIIRNFSQGM